MCVGHTGCSHAVHHEDSDWDVLERQDFMDATMWVGATIVHVLFIFGRLREITTHKFDLSYYLTPAADNPRAGPRPPSLTTRVCVKASPFQETGTKFLGANWRQLVPVAGTLAYVAIHGKHPGPHFCPLLVWTNQN